MSMVLKVLLFICPNWVWIIDNITPGKICLVSPALSEPVLDAFSAVVENRAIYGPKRAIALLKTARKPLKMLQNLSQTFQ